MPAWIIPAFISFQAADLLAQDQYKYENCLHKYRLLSSYSERNEYLEYNSDMICSLGGYHRCTPSFTTELIGNPSGKTCTGKTKICMMQQYIIDMYNVYKCNINNI